MFYRSRLDLAFLDEATARKAIEKALLQLPASVIIKPGQENEERGFVTVEKCYHDEDAALPCDLLDQWLTPSPP